MSRELLDQRVRLAVLDAFWTGSALPRQERWDRLDAAFREATAELEETEREALRERLTQDLLVFNPRPRQAEPTGALGETLDSIVAGSPATGSEPGLEDQRRAELFRLLFEFANRMEQQVLRVHKDLAGRTGLPGGEVVRLAQSFLNDSNPESEALASPLAGFLHDLEQALPVVIAAAHVAVVAALRKLLKDFEPGPLLEASGGRPGPLSDLLEERYERHAVRKEPVWRKDYFDDLFKENVRSNLK